MWGSNRVLIGSTIDSSVWRLASGATSHTHAYIQSAFFKKEKKKKKHRHTHTMYTTLYYDTEIHSLTHTRAHIHTNTHRQTHILRSYPEGGKLCLLYGAGGLPLWLSQLSCSSLQPSFIRSPQGQQHVMMPHKHTHTRAHTRTHAHTDNVHRCIDTRNKLRHSPTADMVLMQCVICHFTLRIAIAMLMICIISGRCVVLGLIMSCLLYILL